MSELHIYEDMWHDGEVDIKSKYGIMYNFKVEDEDDNVVLLEKEDTNKKCVFKVPDGFTLSEIGEYDRQNDNYFIGKRLLINIHDNQPFLEFEHIGGYRTLALGKIVGDNVQNINDIIKEFI